MCVSQGRGKAFPVVGQLRQTLQAGRHDILVLWFAQQSWGALPVGHLMVPLEQPHWAGAKKVGKAKGVCLSTGELLLSWEQLRMRVSSVSSLLCGLSSRGLLQKQLMDQLSELIKLGFDGVVFLHDAHKLSLDIIVLQWVHFI